MELNLSRKIFLIILFSLSFFLILVFKVFSDYGLRNDLNVTLISPENNKIVNTNDINFTFNVEWDDSSIVIKNCILFGNFTGEWAANKTNQTEIVEGENRIYLENFEDGTYEWNVYCYGETSEGEVCEYAESNFILTIDTETPKYSLDSTNSTIAGSEVEHSLFWQDNFELSHAIFSFDNCTGEFKNITEISLSGSEAWSNFTVGINDTIGCTIRWKVYANDTAGNWKVSTVFSYTTTYNPYLTDCSVLDQKNAIYYLTNDIEDSSATVCMEIKAKNIVLDCQGHTIDGILGLETAGILVNFTGEDTNVTIKNCNVKEWFVGIGILANNNTVFNSTSSFNNVSGIAIRNGLNNKIVNCTCERNMYHGFSVFDYSSYNEIIISFANGNNASGFYLFNNSNYNKIIISFAKENNGTGLMVEKSSYNQIMASTFKENKRGIIISNSTNNLITNVTLYNNSLVGLYLKNSENNNLVSSIIQDSNHGIIVGSSKNNKIYNNLLNNTENIRFENNYKNYWNTTKQSGVRIYSNGLEIGGNYWTNRTGNGFSDTCADNNKDGFCDSSYILDGVGNNIDYYPLSNKYEIYCGNGYCESGESCSSCSIDCGTCPPSGGGVGPGTGTGAPPTTTVSTTPGKAVIFIPSIAAMSKANVSIQKTEGIDFTQIVISVRNRVTSVQINITKLDVKPEEVPALANVYRYIRIDKKNIHDEDITEVKFRFRVQKSWINSNNIKVDSIALYRYTYRWEKLNTLRVGEDLEDVYFEATSPGLSYFAIAGEKAKQNCPFECCVGEEEYYDKACASGYKCENHVCVPITVPCTEDWVCSEWSECIEGKQKRVCVDRNNCGTVINKPEEERICEEKLPEEKLSILVFWLGIIIVFIAIFTIAKIIAKKLQPKVEEVKPEEKPKIEERKPKRKVKKK